MNITISNPHTDPSVNYIHYLDSRFGVKIKSRIWRSLYIKTTFLYKHNSEAIGVDSNAELKIKALFDSTQLLVSKI